MKKKILLFVLSVLPIVMVLSVYGKLPEQIPMHWGISGEVDEYGKKSELFLLAGLNILFGLLMPLLPKIDPRKRNYERSSGAYDKIILILLSFLTVMVATTLIEAMQPGTVSVPKVVAGMVALLFILMGNLMPKVKSNFYMGVKTPWALSSDAVWNKTQRLGGKTFFFGGLVLLLADFFLPIRQMFWVLMAVICVICIIPTVASYLWYQREQEENGE